MEGEEARVAEVLLDTAHDGEGLVVVVLAFPNGARSRLQLDGKAVAHMVDQLEIDSVRDLVGRPFSGIARALPTNAAPR